MMVSDHINYLTFEDPGAVHTVRRALKLAEAGDLYGAAETAGVDVSHAAIVSQGLRRGMRFSIGAELDNDPRARPDAQNIVDAMRPDGMIRSVHFLTIDHPEKGPDWQWAFDNPDFRDLYDVVGVDRVWELYMAKLLEDIEKLPGQIVGHFYVPTIFGNWPDRSKLEQYEDKLVDACASRGMAVEINTRFLYRDNPEDLKEQYRTALKRLIKKAKTKDVGIAIGSDAHSPKDQGNAFAEVLRFLDDAGVNEIVFPVAGRLARVALRATKEHLQKVKSQEPAPAPGSSISGFSRAELGLPEREIDELAGSGSKTGHDSGPRKRASGPGRATKKPVRESSERDSRQKAESKPKPEPKPKAEPKVKAEPKAKPEPKAKAEPKVKAEQKAGATAKSEAKAKLTVKAPPKPLVKKAAAKPAPVKKAAAKAAKPAAKLQPKALKAAVKAKAPAKKAVPAKKAAPKKPAAKKPAPTKKAPAKKAAAKKAAPKHKVSGNKRTATKKAPAKRR